MATTTWRPFGSTFHMAACTHTCDRCMTLIEPGDRYGRFVERRNRAILVYKYHDVPECPTDPLEEYQEEKDAVWTPEFRLAA